ncbi:MAG: glycosyltransferase [Planctomycetes bacterium]|nr:glycosyltransferase [Planctomycetota bacterium]
MKCKSDQRDPDRRRFLCVAYAFPPIQRSGTFRTLGFVRHLDRLGWDATVITVEPSGESSDDALLRKIPSHTEILRTPCVDVVARVKAIASLSFVRDRGDGAKANAAAAVYGNGGSVPNDSAASAARASLRDWISRFLMTPDSRTGWVVPAVVRGIRAVRHRRPDVIYSTSPYASAHLIAMMISRLTHVPWVADFRDPWRGNPFRDGKYASLELWDAALERLAISQADHIVCNTPTQEQAIRRRLPGARYKCSTILNGYDPELLDSIEPRRAWAPDDIALTHCGQFYGARSPGVWFAGLRRALDALEAGLAKRIRLVLIGSDTFDGQSLRQMAKSAGVAANVTVLGSVGHGEAISYMAASDALLLAGTQGAGSDLQVPNKLFEYLALKRPIIAALDPANPAVDILRDARANAIVCGSDDDEAVARAFVQTARGQVPLVEGAWSGVAAFARSHRAVELASVFERVVSSCGPAKGSYRTSPQAARGRGESESSNNAKGDHAGAVGKPRECVAHTIGALEAADGECDRATGAGNHNAQARLATGWQTADAQRAPMRSTSAPVSVVCTVAGDVDGLRTMLESLANQTRLPDEVVVVDGGSDTEALSRIRGLVRRWSWVRFHESHGCNIAEGRNRAIRAAQYDVIACIDAGCRANEEWLANLTAPFNDPEIEFVGGYYRIEPHTRFERIVGLLTMPGQLKAIDATRFNPSARSMAFRRSVWERAGGFPNWLYAAEDTLFDMKIRRLEPPVSFAFAPEAVVAWRPRTTLRQVFRQFHGYNRGRGRIDLSRSAHRFTTRRHALAVGFVVVAMIGIAADAPWTAGLALLGGLAVLVQQHAAIARRVAERTGRLLDFANAVLISEWITIARWFGYVRGRADRKRSPEVFVERLRGYFGGESADVPLPRWNLKSAPIPRTLVVAWDWPPVDNPSSNAMAAWLQSAPRRAFRVLTRYAPLPGAADRARCPDLLVDYVDSPLGTGIHRGPWTALAHALTRRAMLRRAETINKDWRVERVISICPSRHGLVAGALIADRLGAPHVVFLRESDSAPCGRSGLMRWMDRRSERTILRRAWMVIAASAALAETCARNGIARTWVVPDCTRMDGGANAASRSGERLDAADWLVRLEQRLIIGPPESAEYDAQTPPTKANAIDVTPRPVSLSGASP